MRLIILVSFMFICSLISHAQTNSIDKSFQGENDNSVVIAFQSFQQGNDLLSGISTQSGELSQMPYATKPKTAPSLRTGNALFIAGTAAIVIGTLIWVSNSGNEDQSHAEYLKAGILAGAGAVMVASGLIIKSHYRHPKKPSAP